MTLAQVLAFLVPLAPVIEPILMNFEQNTAQPEIKALIGTVTSPDLKAFFMALDGAIDAFAQVEIQKV